MPVAASIEFPRADVDALFRQIDRAQKSIGMSMGQAVRTAATAVAASIGASTRVAPKHRDFRETGQWSGNRKFDKKRGRFYVNREFEVTSLQGGVRKDFRIWAKDKSAAKRDKRVIIGRRGLAKMAWRSAAAAAGLALRGIGTQGVSGSARRKGGPVVLRARRVPWRQPRGPPCEPGRVRDCRATGRAAGRRNSVRKGSS